MFDMTGCSAYFQEHIDGVVFAKTDATLRNAALSQAKRELENAIGGEINEADSVITDNIRLDFACYELTMHLIRCAATPGSGGAVPAFLAESSGDVEKSKAPDSPGRWPDSVWRWLGGRNVRLSRG